MYDVNLLSYPNQKLSIDIEDNWYDLNIKDCDGFMVIDISCNNEVLISGQRLIANTVIIPYPYREQGNFVLMSVNDELANWQNFSISQFLYYISNTELAELRGE